MKLVIVSLIYVKSCYALLCMLLICPLFLFILHRAAKLIWAGPAQCLALLNSFKLCYYCTKKLTSNTCYSGSYELLHEAVSCTYKIQSYNLTLNLPFWVPMVNLNKYLMVYSRLAKLTHTTYILHSYTYTYIFIVLCFTINQRKHINDLFCITMSISCTHCRSLELKINQSWNSLHNYLQMDTKL